MDWTDYYTENYLNGSSKTNSAEAKRVLNCIIDLWIAFSAFEFSLKQYKKALQVYEDALNDTIVNSTSKIYISYAKYCVDRNKLATAQKIYIRALCNKLSRADNDILWDKFLELAHQVNKSEDLTLTDLYEAVTQQVPDASVLALPSHLGDVIESKDLSEPQKVDDSNGMEVVAPTETVVKEEVFDSTAVEKLVEVSTGHQQLAPIASKIVVMHAPPIPSVPPAHVTDSGGIVEDLDSFGPMTPEQVIRRFTVRPPMLFSAPFKVYLDYEHLWLTD